MIKYLVAALVFMAALCPLQPAVGMMHVTSVCVDVTVGSIHGSSIGAAEDAVDLQRVSVHADAICNSAYIEVPDLDPTAHTGGLNVHVNGGGVAPNNGDTSKKDSKEGPCDEEKGNPIVFTTGNKVEPELDFAASGEMGLGLTRTYNGYWNGIGIFGRRWLSNYDYQLLISTDDPTSSCYPRPGNSACTGTNQPMWAQRPDGRRIKFNYRASDGNWYEDKASPIAYIARSGNTYVLHGEANTLETYDLNGFPTRVLNSRGIGWDFSYDSNHYLQQVTHTSGRQVNFGWTNGLLTTVTDPAGNAYTYTYSTIPLTTGTLAAKLIMQPMALPVIDPWDPMDPPSAPASPSVKTMVALLNSSTAPGANPTTISYFYEDSRFPTALTGKAFNGQRYSWFAYDAQRRATNSHHANGADNYDFVYEADANAAITKVTITNPLGKKEIYTLQGGNIVMQEGVASPSCGATIKGRTYDSNGYLAAKTDNRGNTTAFTYSDNGQIAQMIEAYQTPEQRVTNYEWDVPNNRITKATLVGVAEHRYSYAADGRIAAETVKNLSANVPASQGQELTTTYTYTYFANGLLSSMVVDGPLPGTGDAVTYSYSATGDLLSVTNGLGQTTAYQEFNALGLPKYVVSPNGDKVGYIYDARGRVIEMQTYRNGATQSSQYEYDGFGRVAKVSRNDGTYHGYQYDVAGRLTSEYEPEPGGTFAQKVYTYNAMSFRTSVVTQRAFAEPARGTVW